MGNAAPEEIRIAGKGIDDEGNGEHPEMTGRDHGASADRRA